MFSLIITLIAIALVAALALATLYYGGPIFNEGADRAQAAKIEAQGQQIMGAMELYHAEKGVYPNALADLVTEEYLRSIPTAAAEQAQLVASALAATGTWSLISPGQPVIVMKPVSVATCKAFNSVNVGTAGILQQAHSTKLKQCIGTDVNNLMIIQPKAVADLLYVAADAGAAVQLGTVLATAIPALSDTSANGFLDTTAPAALTYAVSYSAPTLTFTDTSVGSTSAAQSVIVTNTGTGALTITAASASAPYSVDSSDCSALAPGATCSVSVTFSPLAEQGYSGPSYALTLSSPNGALAGVLLSGTGTAPVLLGAGLDIYLQGSTDAVGALVLGGTDNDWDSNYTPMYNWPALDLAVYGGVTTVFDLTNSGSETLTLLSIAPNTGFMNPGSVLNINCGAQLAPGSSCQISVTAPADPIFSEYFVKYQSTMGTLVRGLIKIGNNSTCWPVSC